jgi:uncharacterized protein DUF4232
MPRPAALPLLLAAGAASVIAACGSGTSATTRRAPSPTPTTTTTTTTATTSAPTSSAGPSSRAARARAAGAAPPCRSGQISVSAGASAAGLGHLGEPLLFQNVGRATCLLRGYPGVALVSPDGRQLQVRRTPSGYLGGLSSAATREPVVPLRPRETASALLEGQGSTVSGKLCPRYGAVKVTPPDQMVASRVARSVSICRPQIHPVVPGSSGRQQS